MNTILLDVDGVIADFAQVYINILNHLTDRNHTVEEITHWDFHQCVSSREEDAAVWNYISRGPHLVRNVGSDIVNLNAVWSLRDRGCRVVAVTSPRWRCPRWMPERADWLLARGFTEQDIVFTSDKSLVQGDMLVDDNFENVSQWQAKHSYGRGILLTRPWNAAFQWEDRIESLDSIL